MSWHSLIFFNEDEMNIMNTKDRLEKYENQLKKIFKLLINSESTQEIRSLKEEVKEITRKKDLLLKQLGKL